MAATTRPGGALLECRSLTKSYSGHVVLDAVDFSVDRGEVHALVGENGAGKSTLIKVVTGATRRDSGEMVYEGEVVPLEHSRRDAEERGIAVIYQELSLIPGMTVAQNIFLGREPLIRGTRLIDGRRMSRMAAEMIAKYDFLLKADAPIDDISIAQRQLVEILKALSGKASLMIMDEPTSSLTKTEVELLFKIIATLKAEGISVLYISHRMEEVYALADRVTVLRDGKLVKVLDKPDISPAEIIRLMIGHKLDEAAVRKTLPRKDGPIVLEVRGLTSVGKFVDVSFDLHEGEVLGIGGLVGSGRTELVRALYGIDPIDSGSIRYLGTAWTPSVLGSIAGGVGFIPEERRLQGILATQSITRNIGLASLDRIAPKGVVSVKEENRRSARGIELLKVRPPRPEQLVGTLSGGNQQKVVLAKWLVRELKLVFIDEPTVGIDIGAKEEIYEHVGKLAAGGVSVVLVSSDLPELTRLSDRVLVLRQGRVWKEFKECVISGESILRAASGLEEAADE